ncbi:Adaptor for signal transduction [Serendipita sp. 396]|nr:Adaptor for signal transduction [Serendipita sp. 396]KAG8802655.1 Adaptor for signal transduction [Serendipita sp. 398]KAG8827270.1 Adaptor for signal transduction [Serendipita sp. 401]KAG8839382.1 Adaptor for signal transduction [Serendipita sp. 400]KAG8858451.1 Adaptor for signal transduction [Serendipita sp. 411]
MADTMQLPATLMDYSEHDVAFFLSTLGLDQYEQQILEHGISGEILQALDSESLKEIGILSVGQRLVILKAVYNLKIRDGIPIEADHYVPPSELPDASTNPTLAQIHLQVQQLEQRVALLQEENYRLQDKVQICLDEVMPNSTRKDLKPEASPNTLRKQPSLKWAPYKGSRSPTKGEHESPASSPQALEHHISSSKPIQSPEKTPRKDTPPTAATPSIPISNSAAPQRSGSSRSNGITDGSDIRSFKVSLEDPAWKVLPAALKKYKIHNDDWQNYAMFICYGNTERCLSYDEKPLLLFQKLKEAKKNPVFMLKHIRDIRSPIAVAQQKQAARKEKERQAQLSSNGVASALSKTSAGAAVRSGNGTLTVDGRTPPLATANLTTSAWPDVMSPITAHTEQPPLHGDPHSRNSHASVENSHGPSQPLAMQSYAIAIYPYSAEQEDEFDVSINDTFIINSRAKGWWIVQKDPSGAGLGDGDNRQGWVPAGCLLETNVPVALAIQDAASRANDHYSRSIEPDRTPIMPSSIVSTSYPGIALTDYRKKGEEELDLVKDDALRVFKRYNHWSYAVKEITGDRGWVPSWFIGKIGSSGPGVPPTPAPHNGGGMTSAIVSDADLRYALDGPAASPVSPGFTGQQTSGNTRGMI